MLDRGASVGIGYHRPDPALDEFVAGCPDGRVSTHRGSLSEADDCRRAIVELVKERGRVDLVVAMVNFRMSGLLSTRSSPRQLTDGEWHRALAVHLSGAFHIAQAALGQMVPAGFGRIVFVVGTAGVGDGAAHHATVRGALRSLTAELARDVAADGITVNQVTTGLIQDELLDEMPADTLRQALAKVPVPRPAELSEITRVVDFLADPASGYLTGQLIAVDGGLTMDRI
jgi:NAD(P)-dependent dehydrogenase (short-subunit alcohol dehydrogenase family)